MVQITVNHALTIRDCLLELSSLYKEKMSDFATEKEKEHYYKNIIGSIAKLDEQILQSKQKGA
jgi:hypothetical protein